MDPSGDPLNFYSVFESFMNVCVGGGGGDPLHSLYV